MAKLKTEAREYITRQKKTGGNATLYLCAIELGPEADAEQGEFVMEWQWDGRDGWYRVRFRNDTSFGLEKE